MKEWILDFEWTEDGYEADVNEEVRGLLETHRYLGISLEDGYALQLFSAEQAEALHETLRGMGSSDFSKALAARTIRIIFSTIHEVDLAGGEPLLVPHRLASFIDMDEWKVRMGILTERDGIVLLKDSGFEF